MTEDLTERHQEMMRELTRELVRANTELFDTHMVLVEAMGGPEFAPEHYTVHLAKAVAKRMKDLETGYDATVNVLHNLQAMHGSNVERARVAGQGQALRALLEEFHWARDNLGDVDLRLDHIEASIMDKLKELGEEPREEGVIP